VPRAAALALGAVGCALVLAGPPPAAAWPALAAMLMTLAIVAGAGRSRPARAAARAAVTAFAGAMIVALRLLGSDSEPTASLPQGDGPWRGVVQSISAPKGGTQSATIELEPSGIQVAATLPRFPEIAPGDGVAVGGRLEPPRDDAYGTYLRRVGLEATLWSRSLEREPAPPVPLDLERLRRTASDALGRAIPEPEAGLAAGILLGLRDRVDRDLAADFTTAGASHVVAISGWNIAIVAASVAALGGRFARRRRSVLTIAAIVAYVAFVGASPSVLRAAAMAAVVLLARESGRAGRAASALAWAATLILVVDPSLVRDAGFQLSTLATAGLLAWSTPLATWIRERTGGRLPGWLTENLGVSLAAQAATLPIVLASFGRLSLVAPLVNLFVVPLVAPAMAMGGIALIAGLVTALPGVPVVVASIGGLPAWALLATVVGIVRAGAGLPFASVTLAPPLDLVAAAIAAALILLAAWLPGRARAARLLRRQRPNATYRAAAPKPRSPPFRLARAERIALVAVAVMVATTTLLFVHRPDGRTRITVLDVGQGDAILVEGSRGGRLLVDGGPDPDRLLIALDERIAPWDHRIDALVLTHPHEDHVAGLAVLLERYRIGRVFEPGMRGPGPGYAAWASRLKAYGTTAGLLSTGDRFALDDVAFGVLWPDAGAVPREPTDTGTGINNVSVVLLGEVGGRRFLLAGDVEEGIDPILLRRGIPHVDLLKVAHHGSRTSSTPAFLDAVAATVAVVSAGAGNPYGHPAPATIARLEARVEHVLRTDTDGSVEVDLTPDRVSVHASGPRRKAAASAVRAAVACGIPVPLLAATRTDRAAAPVDTIVPHSVRLPGPDQRLLYHRPDDGPRARGRRGTPAVPRSAGLVHAALAGRRGGRVLARRADRARPRAGRSVARRDSRAPPRRRQAPAGR
jgi:competence protein ComEC